MKNNGTAIFQTFIAGFYKGFSPPNKLTKFLKLRKFFAECAHPAFRSKKKLPQSNFRIPN